MEEGLNQLPYKECMVTTPTGNKGCYSQILVLKVLEVRGKWGKKSDLSKSVSKMRSLGGAVLLNNLINSEMFSKEIYMGDFLLMACLSIQVKG